MSSLDRMLGVLDLFSESRTGIQSNDVSDLLTCSQATAYRYLRSLCASGFLSQGQEGFYTLGSRIIELDRLLRKTDPLLTNARVVMSELSAQWDLNMMLCSYYKDKVMCADIVGSNETLQVTYERGKPIPLFRGAMAKVILANLSPYQLKNLMLEHGGEIQQAGLGDNWKIFRGNLNKIRKMGSCVTRAEVIKDLIGVAAPIFNKEARVLGSIVFVISDKELKHHGEDALRAAIVQAAENVTHAISMAK